MVAVDKGRKTFCKFQVFPIFSPFPFLCFQFRYRFKWNTNIFVIKASQSHARPQIFCLNTRLSFPYDFMILPLAIHVVGKRRLRFYMKFLTFLTASNLHGTFAEVFPECISIGSTVELKTVFIYVPFILVWNSYSHTLYNLPVFGCPKKGGPRYFWDTIQRKILDSFHRKPGCNFFQIIFTL